MVETNVYRLLNLYLLASVTTGTWWCKFWTVATVGCFQQQFDGRIAVFRATSSSEEALQDKHGLAS